MKLQVLNNRLESVASEMQDVLVRTSHSALIKEARDCSTALFDAQGRTIAQAPGTIPILLGVMMGSVPAVLDKYPVSVMEEGDVYIVNHPYMGGTHLPDVTAVSPVHFAGEVVGLSCAMVHHADLGGMAPGSFPLHATEIYQEGLILPPVKLISRGKDVVDMFDLLRHNSRVPETVIGDFRAQCAALTVGRRRLIEVFEAEGPAVMAVAFEELLNYAELLCRRAIEEIPDGTYHFVDHSDNDGVELDAAIRFEVTVEVTGSRISFDFEGSSPSATGPINSTPANARAVASYVVRTVSGIDMPSNDGAFRPITLRLPEGSIVNPAFPAPVCNRGVTYHRIHDVMMGALFTAVPDRVTAAHNGCPVVATIAGHDDGENWVLGLVIQGGMGARWDQDGIDAITTEVSNLTNQPMESIEMSFPVRVHRRMVVPDSGGAGRFRGGLGQEIEVELLSGEASCSYLAERHSFLPWGVCGGQPAKSSRMTLMRHDGTVTRVEGNKVLSLSAGDRFVLRRPGGGGYGDPLERPAEDVAEDVRTSKVSETAAREDYGVVLDGTSVDEPSTARLRRELAAARGPVTWMFDRGPHGRDAGVPATTRLEEQA